MEKKKETPDDLLDQCKGKDMSPDDEDKAWINDKPVGREKEGWDDFETDPDFPSIEEIRCGDHDYTKGKIIEDWAIYKKTKEIFTGQEVQEWLENWRPKKS